MRENTQRISEKLIFRILGEMEVFTVCFFGHRVIESPVHVERELEKVVRRLLLEKTYVEFLVGRDGDFDLLAASVVRRAKKAVRDDNSALVWVLPYVTADLQKNYEAYSGYYDEIEIFEDGAHYKAAFQKRNRAMIDRSDLVICYVGKKKGGAYQTIRYAEKRGKTILNLFLAGEP